MQSQYFNISSLGVIALNRNGLSEQSANFENNKVTVGNGTLG